ncbi:hypothetical protein M3Y97_00508400 [Aphelenchoides bicaudatus]|nr:hypothetical protein M3Y97_00508400 [Aphelenchoides bicaudatus]
MLVRKRLRWNNAAFLLLLIVLLHQLPLETVQRTAQDNCKSDKLREIILETIGLYPHQYSYQAKHMKQIAESRFGNWWSSVIISERGGYGMSANLRPVSKHQL